MITLQKFLPYCCILLMCSCGTKDHSNSKNEVSLIPFPAELTVLEGNLLIQPGTKIQYNHEELAFTAGYLKEFIEEISDFEIDAQLVQHPELQKGTINLVLNDTISPNEGYHLQVDRNIIIAANNAAGIFYGTQSLLQLLHAHTGTSHELSIPKLTVNDYPRFSWRGMHLDVSRHFFGVDFIKKYIDLLALHKMNKFHWHLVDDQGWRIEIKKYPKLTAIGAWRVDREHLPWNERPSQKPSEDATYGGFYTQEEIKEIVAYAASRHIEVVPEIEMPAHVSSALAAYPEFSCKGSPITVPPGGVWPITDIYCAGKEETFHFLEDILTEVMALFPSQFIHIGGDEADKSEWKKCPRCQSRIKQEGLKNEHELQSYFIRRIEKFLTGNGRRLIGWDEILDGGLAENATVMSWRGEQGGIAAAKMGHDVVMTPVSHCYFDYYQSLDKTIEPLAFGGFTDLTKVYLYEPVPQELNPEEAKHILGAQGNVWTEYMVTGDHVEYMAVPRMTALSEVLWTPASGRNLQHFEERLESFLNLISQFNFNHHIPAPDFPDEMIFIDSLQISIQKPWPFGKIFYTLDGKLPSAETQELTEPVTVTENGEIKVIYILENGKTSKVKSGVYVKKNPLPSIQGEPDVKPGLTAKYYEGSISTLRDFDKMTFKKTMEIDRIGLPETEFADHFGLEIEGLLKIPVTGVYTFKLISDDGSQLLIDDQLIVDADGLHGPEPRSGQVALETGFHRLMVRYFEAGGGKMLEAYMEGLDIADQQIPDNLLYSNR